MIFLGTCCQHFQATRRFFCPEDRSRYLNREGGEGVRNYKQLYSRNSFLCRRRSDNLKTQSLDTAIGNLPDPREIIPRPEARDSK